MQDKDSLVYLGKPIEHWIERLRDKDPLIRRLAVYALSMIGPEGRAQSLPALSPLLDDPQSFVRVWAAAALARIEPSDPRSLQLLLSSLSDEQSFVRSLSAWHLGREGPEMPAIDAALPVLQELLDDADPSVRAEAELALKELQTEGVRARG